MTRTVRIGTICGMSKHHDILRELDEYAAQAGVEVSTVCRKATGNPRLHQRLASRIRRTAADVERLRKFMADNPPVSHEAVSGPGNNVTPATTVVNPETIGGAD